MTKTPNGAPELPPPVYSLAARLAGVAGAGSRNEWEGALRARVDQIKNSPSVFDAYLSWIKTLRGSSDLRQWQFQKALSEGRASCLGLVSGAVLIGRALGVDVVGLAVPNHVLLGIREGEHYRIRELLDAGAEVPEGEVWGRFRVPDGNPAFLRALTDDELVACVLIQRGSERLEAGDVGRAEADLLDAIRLFPDHPAGHYNLGLVKAGEGKWRQAERLFSRAVDRNELDARSWANRGIARLRLGRPVAAEKDADRALLLDPQSDAAQRLKAGIRAASQESPRRQLPPE